MLYKKQVNILFKFEAKTNKKYPKYNHNKTQTKHLNE